MRKVVYAVSLIVMICMLVGCGSSYTLKTDEGNVKIDGDKMQFESKDGKSELSIGENGGKLPDGYPEDIVPIIKGGKIALASKNEDENKKISYWVSYTTDKKVKDVYEYYIKELKDMKDEQKIESDGFSSISGVLDGNSVGVTISPNGNEDDGSMVQVVIAPAE